MKFKSKKNISLLSINQGDIVLKSITTDGFYEYEVNYKISAQKSLQNNINLVTILASLNPLKGNIVNILNSNTIEGITNNILLKKSNEKDINRATDLEIISKIVSDITKKIPNNKTQSLLGSPVVDKKTKIELVKIQDITKQNIVLPVLETNILNTNSSITNDKTLKDLSYNLIKKSIDPASIFGARTNNFIHAHRSSAGLINKIHKNPFMLFSKQVQTIKQTANIQILNTNNPSVHTQLNENTYMNVKTEEEILDISIKETFYLPYDTVTEDSFYITLKAINNLGIEIERIAINVPHIKLLNQLLIPIIPPEVKTNINGGIGKNTLLIKQLDKNSKGINIYKKQIKNTVPEFENVFNLIGSIETSYGDDYKIFIDISSNANNIIYRCIPYNNDNILSAEFTSAGIEAKNKSKINKENITIISSPKENGVFLEFKNISNNVRSLQIFKRNQTLNEKIPIILDYIFIPENENVNQVSYTDNNVSYGRTYEYSVKCIYKNGSFVDNNNISLINFSSIQNNIVDTITSNPEVIEDEKGTNVKFNISSNIINSGQDKIKQFLSENGLLDFYFTEVADEKEKFKNLLAYDVVRVNLTTGAQESFGIINSNQFSDRDEGVVRNVMPLEDGMEYKYVITTHFRAIDTLLKTYSKEIIDSNDNTYILYPYVWRHPITLEKGNLVNEFSLKRNHSDNQFTFGKVASITETNVSLINILPSIKEANVVKISDKSVLLQWRIQGNVKRFDHFLIVLEILGMRSVVGKSHNISNSNYFQFVDILDNNENGKLKYYIIPVFYDYSKGTEFETNEVIV